MPAKKEISLLPDDQNSNLLSARILRWATTVGRFVIVFTELIVIGAFISRFWLDRKNSDLSETVRQQKAILESTSEFENQYRLLQQRLKIVNNYYQAMPDYRPGINSLVESTPPEITYTNLTLTNIKDTSNIKIDLNVVALEESSIINFIGNLILNPSFDSVSVNSIDKPQKQNNYLVNISLILKNQNKTTASNADTDKHN